MKFEHFCRTLTWRPLAGKRSNPKNNLYILHTGLQIFSGELMKIVNSFLKHLGPFYFCNFFIGGGEGGKQGVL